jgi:D-alanyl-lipoteichoic acid acyltransferase DltB (MBOAT superfamily)
MLFNSLSFCAFFIIVSGLYYALPWSARWKMLLGASCYFYMCFVPAYILILLVTIIIDYAMGILIADAEGARRKLYLVISIISTCAVLFVFKYYNFFIVTSGRVAHVFGFTPDLPISHLILPIGLSFHTFQSLSYVIEVFRGNQKPERHFGIYSLYVMFYPQLVAGPIERPQNLLHQFYEHHRFSIQNVMSGLSMMAWGFFRKMVIADGAAVYVNKAYGNWQASSGLELLLATVLFAVQIYADFAGYSSIAIGAARVMGFELMTNFNHPYFSKSIAEYWQRWHISLSTWFKDYLYFPLFGDSGVTVPRHFRNLVITFTVSGLWHGANWTFVIWGLYYGLLLVIEGLVGKWWRKGLFWTAARRVVTLTLILIGFVFFRAQSLSQALGILGRIAETTSLGRTSIQNAIVLATGDSSALPLMAAMFFFIAFMFAIELMQERRVLLFSPPIAQSVRWQAIAVVLLFQVVILFGSLRASSFIYFQF